MLTSSLSDSPASLLTAMAYPHGVAIGAEHLLDRCPDDVVVAANWIVYRVVHDVASRLPAGSKISPIDREVLIQRAQHVAELVSHIDRVA